ncbi:hypothetical protein Thimo_0336 [Thioflavicoccus mobilis 8321]|uniref:Carboxypeptidase regulatory-like domain-containing protein n=1 Tax=Thioflavicoccus mobilis 8321 TaxID=765912 RepID=L0GT70_9GAMM|nr:hypothetical protein [Thioflavicoccus mobilis]AGA89206.1 hypothetical protein Thimo_0336 [Thioflavicoccus mobilis 8321]
MKTIAYFAAAALLWLGAAASAAEYEYPPTPTSSPEAMLDHGDFQGTPWLSGGVGLDEREYILDHYADDFNLKLEFALAGGSYLGDVEVLITTGSGDIVMQALSEGPWFLTRLPAGTYHVQATSGDRTLKQTVQVPASGLRTVTFGAWHESGADAPMVPAY